MKPRTKTIRRPDDFHVHFREGETVGIVAPHTSRHFSRALVMPNLTIPITNGKLALGYRGVIENATRGHTFTPLMTIKITSNTTPETIRDAKGMGVVAGKLYPEGVTHNSADGVRNLRELFPVFAEMQKVGMPLCIHGESPGVFVLDRETDFLTKLDEIVRNFPRLIITLEHITTADAVDYIKSARGGVGATITIHHLLITLHDLLCFPRNGNEFLNPHLYCKPVAKTPRDKAALEWAALSGSPKFFFGSDSAPHPRDKKECECGCAGVYTAPVALALLAEFFAKNDALAKLEPFVSQFGAEHYSLPLNQDTITLEEAEWIVPVESARSGFVPFRIGEKITWSVAA